jgi:hypothetical protein
MHTVEIDTYIDQHHELTIKVPTEFKTGKIKVILMQPDNAKKFTKQELFNTVSYQGSPTNSQGVDEIIYN